MGGNPDGRKVGLVDPHQIWAFMADPCNHSWRSNFAIEGSFPVHVRNMMNTMFLWMVMALTKIARQ